MTLGRDLQHLAAINQYEQQVPITFLYLNSYLNHNHYVTQENCAVQYKNYCVSCQKGGIPCRASGSNIIHLTFKDYFWTPILLPFAHNVHCCYFHMVLVGLTWISLQLIVSVCCAFSLIVYIISDNVHNIVQYVWLHVRDIESEWSTP